jgi:hypothetical protein
MNEGTIGVDEASEIDFKKSNILTGSLEFEAITLSKGAKGNRYWFNETLGVSEDFPKAAQAPLGGRKQVAIGRLDKSLLERAKDIVESLRVNDVMDTAINLDSLRGIILQLWESATNSTQFHQEILAFLETAVISIESPNENQLSVFKEAIIDLENDVLAQAHVDIIRSQFIKRGFSPLAVLSEIEDSDDNSKKTT